MEEGDLHVLFLFNMHMTMGLILSVGNEAASMVEPLASYSKCSSDRCLYWAYFALTNIGQIVPKRKVPPSKAGLDG
jgi:hypothetical protein